MFKRNIVALALMTSALLPQLAGAGVKEYQETIQGIAPKFLNDMRSPAWNVLTPLIDQQVLNDAHSKAALSAQLLFSPGVKFSSRPAKSIDRIETKKKGRKNAQGEYVKSPDLEYKVNSDFLAFRVLAAPANLASTIASIKHNIDENGGMYYLRSEPLNNEGKLTDIVFYLFAYFPKVGYVTEIQIGHPFAFYTFSLDSMLRDMQDRKESTDHIVDLWTAQDDGKDWNNCFYVKVKNQILAPRNEFNLEAELAKAFQGRPVNPELLNAIRAFGEI